jgi:hypothetical protein
MRRSSVAAVGQEFRLLLRKSRTISSPNAAPNVECGLDCSEVRVSSLAKQPPVGEALTEGETPVLRKAENVELLVVHEL